MRDRDDRATAELNEADAKAGTIGRAGAHRPVLDNRAARRLLDRRMLADMATNVFLNDENGLLDTTVILNFSRVT